MLFVCSGNVDRSPTAEALLDGKPGLEVKSAGTWPGAKTLVTKELVAWADSIFVMEEHHKQTLTQIDPEAEKKIIVLGIEDHYLRGDPELARILKSRLAKYFENV